MWLRFLALIMLPFVLLVCAGCCKPDCEGRDCGDDGCGGSCGECLDCNGEPSVDNQCNNGMCPILCCPECIGKCCGDDGCAGACPDNCDSGYFCDELTCICEKFCWNESDCSANQCCKSSRCIDMDCGTLECGRDPVCIKECGPCPQGTECDRGRCVTGPVCTPPCPEGSECIELDSYGEPECVWPEGWLACADDSHCPIQGVCDLGGYCSLNCSGCMGDEDCLEFGAICRSEGFGCEYCMPIELYSCGSDSDCVVAVRIDSCCPNPSIWNTQTVESNSCLEEYPYSGQVPDACKPDCTRMNHCWPIIEEQIVAVCLSGICFVE